MNSEQGRELIINIKYILFKNNICIECRGNNIECIRKCMWHICLDCGYVPEKDYHNFRSNKN